MADTPKVATRPGPDEDPLEWYLREYLSAKIQAKHIGNYNGANLCFNHAVDTAQKLAMPKDKIGQITPFPPNPSSTVNVTDNSKTEAPSEVRKLWPLLAAAVVGASLPLAGWWLGKSSSSTPPAPPTEQQQQQGDVGFSVQ